MWDDKCPEGSIECGKCGLKMDRQLNAAINLYFQMEGLSPSLGLFEELIGAPVNSRALGW